MVCRVMEKGDLAIGKGETNAGSYLSPSQIAINSWYGKRKTGIGIGVEKWQ